jgi:hypothetical protein
MLPQQTLALVAVIEELRYVSAGDERHYKYV